MIGATSYPIASIEAIVASIDTTRSALPLAAAIPAPTREEGQEANLSQAFWQRACELGALDEQQRLAAIELGWSSSWLAALRKHLHLKPAELEPLLALSEATMVRRSR